MSHLEAFEISRRWVAKGDRCKGRSLDIAFDRFFSYFVAYNALYFIAAAKAREISGRQTSYDGDKAASTEAVVDYLGGDKLWNRLQEACQENVKALQEGLKDQKFSVSVHRHTREINPERDKELATALESADAAVRSKALLTIVYSVRCNMFHGQKLLAHVQKEPLNHASTVLRQTVNLLASKLDAA